MVSDVVEVLKLVSECVVEFIVLYKVKSCIFYYLGGLVDFVKYINCIKNVIYSSIVDFFGKGIGYEVEIVM